MEAFSLPQTLVKIKNNPFATGVWGAAIVMAVFFVLTSPYPLIRSLGKLTSKDFTH